MVMKIRITRLGGDSAPPRELTLQTRTAKVGRSTDNDVILDDPDRVVSGHHAVIESRGKEIWITDLSRNGTFVNQSTEPLPPHQAVALAPADRVNVGPFELCISLVANVPAPSIPTAPPEGLEAGLPGLFGTGQTADILNLLGGGEQAWEGAGAGPQPRLRDQPFADAAALDSRLTGRARAAEPQTPPSLTPVEQVCFRAPQPQVPAQTIPEGYDILRDIWTGPREPAPSPAATPSGSQAAAEEDKRPGPTPPALGDYPAEASVPSASPLAAPAAATPLPGPAATTQPLPGLRPPPPPFPPRGPVAASPAASGGLAGAGDPAVLSAFFNGLGISNPLALEHPEELMHEAGALLRELVTGLIGIMMGRAQFKSELRLGVTTIRPVENNPFKFAVDAGDLLERLLLRPSPGFMPALAAAHEAFDDIRAHEMAMTAGLQAALRALLARFAPAELEVRLSGQSRLDQWLPLARKAHFWDLFTATYAEVAADASEDFMQLFGDAFAAAYREQIERLAARREGVPAVSGLAT